MKTAPAPPTTGFDPVELIETHQAGVWRYLRALGCQPAQADDLTQETFLAVLRKPFEYRGREAAAAYLRRVARRQWLMSARKSRIIKEVFSRYELNNEG